MKNHRFPWLRNRTTDNRKCEKARNIKEKRTIEMFSTASKQLVALPSSASVNQTSPRDKFHRFSVRLRALFRWIYRIFWSSESSCKVLCLTA